MKLILMQSSTLKPQIFYILTLHHWHEHFRIQIFRGEYYKTNNICFMKKELAYKFSVILCSFTGIWTTPMHSGISSPNFDVLILLKRNFAHIFWYLRRIISFILKIALVNF